MTIPTSIVRSSYVVYWLLFAYLAVQGGRYPGFVGDPAAVPYPFFGVTVVSLLVGVFLAIFYSIVQPTNPQPLKSARFGGHRVYVRACDGGGLPVCL